MASNFFDQFDTSTAKPEGGGNFFDQFDPASAKPEPDPGFVARLGQGASRALDSAKTALTDDPNKIAKIAADQARTALPQTPLQQQLADEFKPYVDAANKAEGFVDNVTAWGTAGLKRAGQLLSNPAEAGKMIAEQLPNSLPGIAGGFAGAKAGAALGSLAGPVGTAVGGVLGGVAGGFAGSYGLEKGAAMQEQVQQEAQKRKIDIQNQEAVAGMVAQKQPEFEATAQRKGVGTAGTDAILNVATMGLAGIGGRAIAKEAQALHAAVKGGAMDAAEASTRLAALESAQAARNTLGAKALRGTGVVGAEMVGEGLSEAVGQQYAYGQIDAGQVIDESLLGLGSGGAMALGSKTFNKAAGIVDQDATTQRLAAASAEIERQLQADSQVGQNAEAAATEAGSAAGSTEPQLGNTPDPLISFPDGSVGRHSEVEKYINDLPEDQRAVARAKLNAQLQAETRMVGLAEEEQGEPSVPQTAPPDGAAVLAEQQAQAQAARDAQIAANRAVEGTDDEILASTGVAMRPSEAMGLRAGPDGGALENAAALAVDTGATDQMQQAAAQAQAAEAAQKVKPANQKQEQKTQATQSVNQETGEISGMPSMADWSDVDLSAAFRNAQSKDVRRQLAGELSRRRAAREEAALQAELQPAATEPLPLPQGQVAPQSPPVNPNGDSNGTQADQAQQSSTQPAQAGSQAFAAAERHPTWRQNAIQAGRVARALGLEPKGKRLAQIVAEIDAVDAQQTGAAQDGADLSSGPIDQEWSAFAPETGTLGIARAQMPQIKAEHRGALVNFLKARGIDSAAGEVPANDLKPTQAEFAPGKVKKAREFQGSERSILVSSDGHVVDGHHQWLAKRAAGEPVKVIRLKAPIRDVLAQVAEFPSTRTAEGAARAMPAQAATENVAVKLAKDEIPGESSALAAKQRWEQAKADDVQQAERDKLESDKYNAYVREQEFQAERRRLQGDRTIQQASGKPFKTEASAKAKLDEFDLGDTHAIGQVDGGFVLRDKREGRESYMQARDAVLADMGIGENADGEIDATEPQWAEIERRIAERLGRKPAEDATQQPASIAPANVQEGIAQARAKRKPKTPEALASQAQAATDSGAFAQGQGAMFSRAGNAGTEAEREFKETERAYGGRAAYDRAKAAGKTRLTYGQWVQVRTPKFKAWFGDWEAVRSQDRLDAMEPIKVRVPEEWRGLSTGELRQRVENSLLQLMESGEPLRHPEVGDVSVVRKGIKKALASSADPVKLRVLGDLRSAFESSFLAGTQPARGEAANVLAYDKLLARLEVGGSEVVAVFTVKRLTDGSQFYNTVTLEDGQNKTPVASPRDTPIAGEHATSANTGVSDFVRRPLARVNTDAVSNVIDPDTGEPLVVYHGTQDNFSVFDTDNSRMGPAAWFTPNKLLASGHAKDGIVMPVYLSIKRPYEAKNATEASLITADRKAELISLGYDGIHEKRGAIEQWVAFYPEQVKSATGNNGEFDGTNSDIRFSRMDDNAPTEGASNDQQQTASGIPAGLPAKRTADSERLERGINAELQRFADPSAGLFRAETVPQDQLPDALRRALGEFRAATGTQVHIFRNLTPQVLDFNGVNFRDGIVHINEDSQNPATLTAAHEWLHNLRRTDPALYAQLAKPGLPSLQLRKLLAHVQKQKGAAGFYGTKNVDEFVAEVFTNPDFQKALRGMSAPAGNSLKSAWDGFVRILRSILGLSNDSLNALSQALELGVAAMREDMGLRKQGVRGESAANFGADDLARMGDTIKAVTVTNIKERAGWKLTDWLGMGLQALGRRQLVDIYGSVLPLDGYNRLAAQMEADKNEVGAGADELATAWGKLKDERQLAELMHDATLAQIDPQKDYVNGDDKARYQILRGRFSALTPEAQKVYIDARGAYQGHHANVRQAIKERIQRSELKGERKAALLKQMDDEFFKSVKGVYFPLARFGQYVVVVKGSDGKVASVNRAETMAEAQALRASLVKAFPMGSGYAVGRPILSKEFVASRDAVGRGFMTELYQVLDKQEMDAAQRAELEDTLGQLYLSSLPDLSWAKHGIHRKGTPGFSQDARRAYAQNMFHGARYLAKLRYSDLMQDELNAMQEHVDGWKEVEDFDQPKAQRVVDEFNKRHESLMNPKSNPVSTALTSFGFIFHLGLSPASAMVNLSQTALVAYPVMGAKWGFGRASAALLKASKEAAQGKNDITGALNADERLAYDEAVRAGTIDVTMAHDLAGIAQGEDAGVMWKIRPVMKWASFMFHHAERFNRQVTFIAAYRLARETGAAHEVAFEQATKATYDGHFDYSSANRPRIMQGNVARVLLLFKQYGQNMVYTLTRNAYQAIKGDTAQEKTEARRALSGLLVMHGMAAGVLGLPMVTTLLAAASMLGGDDDEPWDAKVALQNMLADAFGQKPAEVLSHGLSRLTPWDISGRVGLDKLIFPDVQEGLEGQRLAESAMTAALGPVAGIGINVLKGLQEMSEGRYARGLEAMAPSVLRGPVKALRYGTEGVKDKTGIVVQDEVDAAALLGQTAGFSPSSVRNAYEGKAAIVGHDKALQARRTALVERFAMAAMAGDEEGKAEAREAIAKFNEKNPGRRILPMQLAQSVRMRTKRIEQAQDGVYLPTKRRDAMEAGRFALGESD